MRAALLILFGSMAAWAQTSPQASALSSSSTNSSTATQPDAAQKKEEEKGRIVGRVTNVVTDEPLKKARVDAYDSGGRKMENTRTVTDSQGKFVLYDLAPGSYAVNVTRNGFVSPSYGERGAGTIVTVSPGGTSEVAIKLVPQSVVVGRVVDEDGEPMARMTVSLVRFTWINGKRTRVSNRSAETNDLGEYRIYGVAAAKYFVSASYDHDAVSFAVQNSELPDNDYATVYYPGVTDPQGAVKVEVPKATQVRGIDFTIQKQRTYRVSGRVVNIVSGSGKTGHLMVMIQPKASEGMYSFESLHTAETDSDGKFEVRGLPPGTYRVISQTITSGNHYGGEEVISISEENVKGVVVTVGAGFDVAGSISIDGDARKPVDLSEIHPFLSPEDQSVLFFFGGPYPTATTEGGTFKWTSVGPGRFSVRVYDLPEGYYMKSAQAGSQDLLDGAVEASALQGGSVRIVISPNAATMEGSVKNEHGETVTNATTVAVPEPAKRSQPDAFQVTHPDQSGHYRLSGVRPGSYTLYAFQNAEPGIWQDPDFLTTMEKEGTYLHLDESQHETKDLKITPVPAN